MNFAELYSSTGITPDLSRIANPKKSRKRGMLAMKLAVGPAI
jgi:hypothetical protein